MELSVTLEAWGGGCPNRLIRTATRRVWACFSWRSPVRKNWSAYEEPKKRLENDPWI